MLEAGRRSAISTSQLGLYFDRSDRYNRNRSSSITRKFAIGVMVVVVVLFVAIFLYDFTSATSVNSKLNQETKHIYILQNALKKPPNVTKKFYSSTVSPEVNSTNIRIESRSDNENPGNPFLYDETDEYKAADAEIRSQNLNNFKLRKRVLKSVENNEEAEGKQLFDNHALVYRVRHRHKHPDSSEEVESSEESRPVPFHWELKTPQPTAFKRPRYPQLSQYRYPHASRNIQDIIKYLTNDAETPNRGIKFTGVYVNPKKYDMMSDLGGMMSNDRSEEDDDSYPMNDDPFYQYKPKHPADVNLLATSNFRFSPTGLYRYNYDAHGRPLNYNKQPALDVQLENSGSYTNSYSKRRKPKPFSVMLDIYPISDIMEQNKKITRPRQVPMEDYDLRRPIQFNRGPKFYASPPQSMTGLSNQAMTDEEERQQMIFHLNLYPRKKNKLSRHDIIHRSESMEPAEQQQFVNKVWSPLETIAKHIAVERSKFVNNEMEDTLASNRYQETILDAENETKKFEQTNDSSSLNDSVPFNHKPILEEDYANTDKYEFEAQKIVATTTENECVDCDTTVALEETTTNDSKNAEEISKDVDTIEGFKRFSDSISGTN
ncbi:uncharacterized protein LOC100879805 [Megachile rotundata]|uniref:uncharacterized protein LOC100879805 n=1 Tax=Megachile rotundata TaxID=143995 RepID=UPI003FD107DA